MPGKHASREAGDACKAFSYRRGMDYESKSYRGGFKEYRTKQLKNLNPNSTLNINP